MKLFDGDRAPNPQRIRVPLAEKGIYVPLVTTGMDTPAPSLPSASA